MSLSQNVWTTYAFYFLLAARKRKAASPPSASPPLQLPCAAAAEPCLSLLSNSYALSVLVVLLVCELALLAPSDGSRIAAALASRRPLHMPPVRDLVPREETEAIVRAVTLEGHFVVVEGGNRMGKSIAVRAAAVALSRSRAVLWYNCTEESTMDAVLRGLYGLDSPALFERLLALGAARPSVPSLVLQMGAKARAGSGDGRAAGAGRAAQAAQLCQAAGGRASLQQQILVMDSPFVRSFVEQRCGCTALAPTPALLAPAPALNSTLGRLGSSCASDFHYVGVCWCFIS